MKKEDRPPFAQNLIKARNAHGWTQKKAADMLGASMKSYQSWEEGRAKPDVDFLPKIVYIYKIGNLLSFITNPSFDIHNQEEGWLIEMVTPLEEKYECASQTARAIVDLTLGIGGEVLPC